MAVRSSWPWWIPTEVGVGLCPAEGAAGPMEKMPRCSDGQIWRRAAERPVGSCCLLYQARIEPTSRSLREWICRALVRVAPLCRQLIWNASPHSQRVVWVENALSGCRKTRQTGISISHRSLLGL
jgi:hypothetical protein